MKNATANTVVHRTEMLLWRAASVVMNSREADVPVQTMLGIPGVATHRMGSIPRWKITDRLTSSVTKELGFCGREPYPKVSKKFGRRWRRMCWG